MSIPIYIIIDYSIKPNYIYVKSTKMPQSYRTHNSISSLNVIADLLILN